MPDALMCPRCGTDLHDHGAIAWPVEMDDPGRTIYRCATDGCGPLAVVEGDKVTWFYPDGGEELALLRAAWKADEQSLAFWDGPGKLPLSLSAEDGRTVNELSAALTVARGAVLAYYAAHPEARP